MSRRRVELEHSRVILSRRRGIRILKISLLAALTGMLAGFMAFGLYKLIGFITNLAFFQRIGTKLPDLADNQLGWWVLVVPVIGAFIVGLMIKYGSKRIIGHGVPEAMEAVLFRRSRVKPKVLFLKPISAAIAIGTGGPFGAEGPIIQGSGALGSVVGQAFKITAAERKILLACGAGAGMAATFSTPIAGVIMAIELMLFEFKARSFIPLVIATTLATAMRYSLMGHGPMFEVNAVDFKLLSGLPFYILMGVITGFFGIFFTKSLYRIDDFFKNLPIGQVGRPMLGAFILGLIGYFHPNVLGVGYDSISAILSNKLVFTALLSLFVFKTIAFLIALGSRTSGGMLAPMFLIGAALGGAFASGINHLFPVVQLPVEAFALVGMAALFGSTARATFTLIVFAFEITQDYHAILPLMLVCVIADAISVTFMENSIMTEKIARHGYRVDQDYQVDVLRQVLAGTVMDKTPIILYEDQPVEEVLDKLRNDKEGQKEYKSWGVIDHGGNLKGVVHLKALKEAKKDPGGKTVGDLMRTKPFTILENAFVEEALTVMLEEELEDLPVLSTEKPHRLVGYLSRTAVLDARMEYLHKELVLEPGWLSSLWGKGKKKSPFEEDDKQTGVKEKAAQE